MALPKEYTPELNEALYNRMAQRIETRGGADVGRARSEALSRGLQGDPFETSQVNSAREGTRQELNEFDLNLTDRLAGLGREERLIGEDRAYRSTETQKDRDWRERMEDLRYQRRRGDEEEDYNREAKGAAWKSGAQLLGRGVAAYFTLGGSELARAASGKGLSESNKNYLW